MWLSWPIWQLAQIRQSAPTDVLSPAVYDNVFAYAGAITYATVCLVAFPAEILRIGADNGALVNFDILSESCTAHNGSIRHNLAAVANLSVGGDIRKRMDCYVFAKFGRRIYIG